MTDLRVVAILFVLLFAESAALYPWPRMYKQARVRPSAAQRERPPMPDFVPVRPYRTTPTQQFKHAPTGRNLKVLRERSLARMPEANPRVRMMSHRRAAVGLAPSSG